MIGHHLWNYMKDNYSIKKTNYLVGSQIEKYKHIMKDIQAKNSDPLVSVSASDPLVSDPSVSDLKADLEDFLSTIETPIKSI
jgi:hypothetical protein